MGFVHVDLLLFVRERHGVAVAVVVLTPLQHALNGALHKVHTVVLPREQEININLIGKNIFVIISNEINNLGTDILNTFFFTK